MNPRSLIGKPIRSSSSRVKVLRVLTLISFFHFFGLNNGFTFMAMTSPGMPSASFAPVAIQSFCTIVNPFKWDKAFQLRRWSRLFAFSTRTLKVSSQNVIRKFHPKKLLNGIQLEVKAWSLSKDRVQTSHPEVITSPLTPKAVTNPSFSESRSHASLRRTNERKPEEPLEVNLLDFDIQRLESPELKIKAKAFIESQASLPSADRLNLWRHARGLGEDAGSFFNIGGLGK